MLLPDDLIDGHPNGVLSQMLPFALEKQASVIAVEQIDPADVSKYGIVDSEVEQGLLGKLRGIVEKPSVESAPSALAVVGRYILHPSVMETLE